MSGPRPAPGPRRLARERALSLLYEAEVKGIPVAEVMAELPVPPVPMAQELAAGVGERLGEIDGVIRAHARGWALERMPAVDRALLRVGVFELLHRPDVPVGVVISEAVELAAQYSTEDSSRFVNGMLSRIAEAVRAATAPGA